MGQSVFSFRWYRRSMLSLCAVVLCWSALGCSSAADRPFTIVVLPDTQYYSKSYPDTYLAQTDWIARNSKRENMVFVTHVGDIVQDHNKHMKQWELADRAMSRLDGVVPWGVALGNHDLDKTSDGRVVTGFLKHFNPQRFAKYDWFGGASPNGVNSYQTFSAGGTDFLILHLEMEVPDPAIEWAHQVLKQHPARVAIVTTHSYLLGRDGLGRNTDSRYRGNSGEEIWEKLIRRNPQIFMVICGHIYNPVDYHQISTNDAGNKVCELLVDYQRRPNGGDGWLRLLRFDPQRKAIDVRTYSPTLDKWETDEDSQFTLPLELPDLSGAGSRAVSLN